MKKRNTSLFDLADKRIEEEENTLGSRASEQKSDLLNPTGPVVYKRYKNSGTDLFDKADSYLANVRNQEKAESDYRASLPSDADREAYDRVKASNGVYHSPYLADSTEGKEKLKFDNDDWNKLSESEKRKWLDIAEGNDRAKRYFGDVSGLDQWKLDYAKQIVNDPKDHAITNATANAVNTFLGFLGKKQNVDTYNTQTFDKDREQAWMFRSLPQEIRDDLVGTVHSPSTKKYLEENYSPEEVEMLYKYGQLLGDTEEVQDTRNKLEEKLSSDPLYATVVAPLQQNVSDLAQFLDAPNTMLNVANNSNAYGVVNNYQTDLQKHLSYGQYIQQSINEGLSENTLARFLYNTNMSALESTERMVLSRALAGTVTSIAPSVPYNIAAGMAMNGMMGLGVMRQEAVSLMEQGVPASKAIQTALMRGVFECAFETISLDKLGYFDEMPVVTDVKTFAKNLMKAGFVEGSEEVATDLANELYDYFAAYDYSDYKQFADAYRAEHPRATDEEIWPLYNKKFAGQLVESFLGGAVSGMAMGSVQNATAWKNGQELGALGANVSDASASRMEYVVNALANAYPNVRENLQNAEEAGEVYRRGFLQKMVNGLSENYEKAIDKASNEKELNTVMENMNTNLNSVISEEAINKYNAKMVEFGKEWNVDYQEFIQRRDSNPNTTFSDLAFGNGNSEISQKFREDESVINENLGNAFRGDEKAYNSIVEARNRILETRSNAEKMVENYAMLGKTLDSNEVRQFEGVLGGTERMARAFSVGKMAGEETVKTSKVGSIASMTQEEINQEFGENAAHIVDYSAIRGKKNYQLAYNIGKALTNMGINVRLYESDRNKNISNGFYKNGTIYLDINAGTSGVHAAIGETFSHELTHWMRSQNEEGYQRILNFVKNELGDEFDKQVQKELGKLKNKDNNVAEEEVVANACAKMLQNSETFKRYAIADMTGAQKILAKLREFISNLKKAFKGSLYEQATSLINDMEGLQKEWEQALNEAIALGAGMDLESMDDTVVHNAVRTVLSEEEAKKVAKMISEKLGVSEEEAREYVDNEQSLAAIILQDEEYLDFTPDNRYDAIKKNSDYPQGTADMTNLCRKRAIFTQIFDSLQKAFPNQIFNAMDLADIRQVLKDNDYQVACALCFVEDRRQNIGEIAESFIDRLKTSKGGVFTKVNAEGKVKSVLLSKARANSDVAKRAGFKTGEMRVTDDYIPTQYDLTTYEGFLKLTEEHPQIAVAFEQYNASRGQQSGRLVEGRAEYNREILKWSPAKIKKVNNLGGLRIFSFSDFEAVHLLDICQIITDCAAKGVKIQAYTKVPVFAKLVADTGIKLNRSLIPWGVNGYMVDKNGVKHLKYDNVEGINTEDKDFFDSSDNANIGNILVGINDEQIRLAMKDNFVDYIIPFHTSQAKSVLEKKGINLWKNYKEYQTEKWADGSEKKISNVNIYTEVIDKYHPTNKWEFVDAFVKECQKQGKIPRFNDFLDKTGNRYNTVNVNGKDYIYTPGYEKLLIDFKLFDKNGNILPQTEVNPRINMEVAEEILRQESRDARTRESVSKEVIKTLEKKYEVRNSSRDSEGNTLTPEQAEFFKDSKARDENGNLLRLYHGTGDGGFTVFDSDMSEGAFFFTDSESVAKTYSGTYDTYTPEKPTIDSLNEEIQAYDSSASIKKEDGVYVISSDDGFEYGTFDTIEEADAYVRSEMQAGYNSMNYQVYLNLTNPLIVDAKRQWWDELNFEGETMNTREISAIALERGYDGVIFKNIYDTAIYGNHEETNTPSNIYVAFSPNQVKSVNNTNPTENEDIRYSQRDSEGNTLSPAQQKYFAESKVRDEEGNLQVVYHGTGAVNGYTEFYVFEPSEWVDEVNGKTRVKGYFSENEQYASNYGQTAPYYLNIKNPLNALDRWSRTLPGWKRWFASKGIKGVKFDSSIENDTVKGGKFETGNEYSFYEIIDNMGNYWNGDGNVTEKIEEAGYDGICWDENGTCWVAFNRNAIKRTDNLTPTESDDIRYSEREGKDLLQINTGRPLYKDDMRFKVYLTNHFKLDTDTAEYWSQSIDRFKELLEQKGENFEDVMKSFKYDGTIDEFGNVKYFNGSEVDNGKKRYKNPEKMSDAELNDSYMSAVKSKDFGYASDLVTEAAKRAGYTSGRLYHGTNTFGFTQIDYDKSDDHISFFGTDDPSVAKSYTKDGDIRAIGKPMKDTITEDSPIKDMLSVLKRVTTYNGHQTTQAELNKESDRLLAEAQSRARSLYRFIDEIDNQDVRKFIDAVFHAQKAIDVKDAYETIRNIDRIDSDLYTSNNIAYDNVKYQVKNALSLLDMNPSEYVTVQDEYGNRFDKFWTKKYLYDTIKEAGQGGGIYEFFGKENNAYVIECNGSEWNEIELPDEIAEAVGDDIASTREIAEWAYYNGYGMVIFKDVRDVGTFGNRSTPASNVYAYLKDNGNQIKSADTVTYDEKGKVIPLSERFNKEEDDIRYSIRDIANSESEMLVNALKTDTALADDKTSRYSLEQYAKEYNNLKAMENESIKLAKSLKNASPSERDAITKKILRLDRQILKATEKLTEMRTQRVLTDVLVSEWEKRLADVEWTNELTFQKTKKALEERYGRAITGLKMKSKEQKQEIRDRYEINKRKKNIEKKTKEIMNRILHPTEKKHIPSILINPIVEMLDAIDYWTPAENRRVTKKSESLRERFINFREAVKDYQKEIDEGAELTEYMFDPEFLETVDELCKSVKGIDNVNDMSVEDIVKLDQTLTELNHLISRGNKMITASHYATINDAVGETYNELSKREDVRKAKGNLYQRLNAGMSDSYAFGQYGGAGAANIIDMLSKAFEKKILQVREGKEFAEKLLKGKDTKSWSKDKIAFKTEGGDTIELTVAQMMELYLLNNREQARGHIYGGGINIEDKKGKFRKAVKVTEEDVNNIIRYLRNVPGAIEVADGLQNFGATTVTGWGNEASNLLYGISKFTDPNYWQIRSDSASLKENATSEAQAFASMFKLQNLGRTKAVKQNANNALYIGDVFDTFAKTIDEMSSYGSILPATTDAMRWYNSSVAVDDNTRIRVKALLQNKLGTDMARVFTDTIRALNGGILGTDSLESLVKVMTGRAKAAAVAGNLRVVLQQPTAYTRAFSVIPAKYLLRALTMRPSSAEAQEKSPIAWHKAQGFYSNGLAPSLRKLIVGDQTVGESITEKALWLAGKADDITWGALWNASKLMVNDTTNLQKGSDEYWKKVNEVFSDIINKTQVVDTPLTKSTWMRGNGVGIYFTAFMAEPTKTYSMVSTAIDRVLQHPHSAEAKKALAIAGFTFGLNAIVNAFAQAIADAARDDDKEKDYFEKFREQWKEDVVDNLNPLTYVPVVKDAWSAINGYSSSRLDLQAIQNSVYAMNELKKIASGKSTKTLFGQVEQVSKAVSSWTGIPVSNVMRTMNSFGNLMGIDAFRRKKYTNTELARNIALSVDAGNAEDVEKYTKELSDNLAKSNSSRSVDDYVSDYLADHSEKIDEWAERYYDDPTTLNDAIADMSEWYSPDVVVSAIKKSINHDAEDKSQKVSTSTAAGTIYNSGDINRMLQKGDIKTAQEIIDTMQEGYAEMGSSASPKTQITSYWKPIYQSASLQEKEEIRKMLYKLNYKGKQMYSAKDFEKWK